MFIAYIQNFLCSESRNKTSDEPMSPKKPAIYELPPHEGKYLVLDLDETLIHTRDAPFEPEVQTLHFQTTKSKARFYVAVRPHLKEFLEEMSSLYTIVIFTASPKEYAETMIKRLGIGKYIERLLHKKNCRSTWHGLTKDLSILGVPLKDVILVDDLLSNSHFQPDNILLIEPFEGAKDDKALHRLIPFLKELATLEDVRHVDSRYVAYTENSSTWNNDKKKEKREFKESVEKKEKEDAKTDRMHEPETIMDKKDSAKTDRMHEPETILGKKETGEEKKEISGDQTGTLEEQKTLDSPSNSQNLEEKVVSDEKPRNSFLVRKAKNLYSYVFRVPEVV